MAKKQTETGEEETNTEENNLKSPDTEESNTGEETPSPTETPLARDLTPTITAMAKVPEITPTRRKPGNHIFFLEAGLDIEGIKVDENFDPTGEEKLDLFQFLGNSEEVTPFTETEDDPEWVFELHTRKWVNKKNTEASTDGLRFTLTQVSQVVTEIQNRTKLVDGQSVKPRQTGEVGKHGWLLTLKYNNQSQLLLEQYEYGILKIDGDITENYQLSKPPMVFEFEDSEFAQMTPHNGYGYAPESTTP